MKLLINRLMPAVLVIFSTVLAEAQQIPITIIEYPALPEFYSAVPKEVNESSGLILLDNDLLTHNDSGGEPFLYRINRATGKIIQRILVENARNVDWEDIAQDETFIYIGDFGNNRGNRQDLTIYKVKKSDITEEKKPSVRASVLRFSYGDQESFETNNRNHDFDCEALVSFGDSLIIFTKNWIDGRTRMYKLPKTPGVYTLDPVAEFDADGLVTGADYNHENGNLVLIGYQDRIPFIYLFTGFTGYSFHSPAIYRFNFPRMNGYQTEGIVWLDANRVVISNESRKDIEQAAHLVDLKRIIDIAPPPRN